MQIVLDVFVTASTTAVGAVGLLLVTKSSSVLHFAHGAVFVMAAYVAVLSSGHLAFSLWFSLPVAVLAASALGCVIEGAVYRPLRRSGASALVRLVASLGLYIVGEQLAAIGFGAGVQSFRNWPVREGVVIGSVGVISPANLVAIGVAVGLLLGLSIAGRLGRTAVRLRAVWCNPALATVVGVDHERTRLVGVATGSALSGAAGLLVAADTDVFPLMGLQPLMMALAAMVIGGNSVRGTMIASVVVGTAVHLGVVWLPIRWQSSIVFVILLAALLLRQAASKSRSVGLTGPA